MFPSDSHPSLSRRALLTGAGAVAALAATASLSQAAVAVDEHAHHHHAMADSGRSRLIDSASDCLKSGEACNAHCLELFRMGDTSVAGCAASVQEMLAACAALAKLATYNSRHLKAAVQLCIDVCADCEKECRKHEQRHAQCKACADDCAACIVACKAYMA